MTPQSPLPREATQRWVSAILVVFLAMGFSFGTWLSRLPAVRDELGASTLQMSVYGLCLAVGSLLGMLVAGPLIERRSPRQAMTIAIAVQLVLLPAAVSLLLAGAHATLLTVAGLALLLLYGLSFSVTDIAMNVSGAVAERALGKARLPLMHACYSIGVMVAMGLGAAAEALRLPLQVHFLIVVALIGVFTFAVLRWVPLDEKQVLPGAAAAPLGGDGPLPVVESSVPGGEVLATTTGSIPVIAHAATPAPAPAGQPHPTKRPYSPWRDRRVLLIGLITLCAGLIEGTPADWLPLALVDGRGMSNELGAIVLGVFFASVVVARLAGSPLLERFGRVTLLRASFVCATIGVLTVLIVPGTTGVFIGTVLWGLGTGVCWPITISAAADDPATAARNVAVVSAIGYTSLMLGPMAFGFLGEIFGLLQAFWVLPFIAVAALLLSGVTRPR